MASKETEFEVVEPGRYRSRMMQVGDRLTLRGTNARIWAKVGKIYTNGPRLRPVSGETVKAIIPTVEEVLSAEVVEEAPKAEAPKPAPKKTPPKPRKKPAAKK